METIAGITYSKPKVTILQSSGLGVAEIAARTCYDSFEASENTAIKEFDSISSPNELVWAQLKDGINAIDSSELLTSLAWVHHHHSILEHSTISFHIKGTSRGVLQEFARHRIQAISVRSTRYTMSSVINAYTAAGRSHTPRSWFIDTITQLDMFVTPGGSYVAIEAGNIYDKLWHQQKAIGFNEFTKISVAKSSIQFLQLKDSDVMYEALQAGKKKRNVGDAFKHIVTDNWKVDLVSTMNLRALKNFLTLRDSGAAYFGIRHVAQAMKAIMPSKYLDLIVKY